MTVGHGSSTVSTVVRRACVLDTPLSVDRMLELVTAPEIGGVAVFVGIVRDTDQDQNAQKDRKSVV